MVQKSSEAKRNGGVPAKKRKPGGLIQPLASYT